MSSEKLKQVQKMLRESVAELKRTQGVSSSNIENDVENMIGVEKDFNQHEQSSIFDSSRYIKSQVVHLEKEA